MKIYSCELEKYFFFVNLFINNFINFSPLIKLTDRLLLVGVLTDDDVRNLLLMIDPETWDDFFDRGL
jgi:hypothetical protein